MSRTNIFEILDQKENIISQINKIEELLSEVSVDNSIPEDIVMIHLKSLFQKMQKTVYG